MLYVISDSVLASVSHTILSEARIMNISMLGVAMAFAKGPQDHH